MKELVFVKANNKELRDFLINIGFKPEQNWEEEYFDMGTGIALTPEITFYVTVEETEPDPFKCYTCYESEDMFKHFAEYYRWHNTTDKERGKWCDYCSCEGGCNLCENLLKIYNKMLVKYIGL